MKKYFIYGLMSVISLSSCRAGRNAKTNTTEQPDSTAFLQVDSTKTLIADSSLYPKETLKGFWTNNLMYQSFYAKIKFAFDDGTQNLNATAYVHIKKDSVIWVSITGPLNIEVAKMLITKDSVTIVNKFEKTVQLNSIDVLQQATGLPIDFVAMQNIITCQPFFTDTVLKSFTWKNDSLLISTNYNGLINTMTIDTVSKHIIDYFLMDEKSSALRSCEINNTSFVNDGFTDLPMERDIIIKTDKKITINLHYKETEWNQSLNYLFKIPENYIFK